MTGGFAILAYPAKYRSSGVMTFIVGPDGTIYESDLAPVPPSAPPRLTRSIRIRPGIPPSNPDAGLLPMPRCGATIAAPLSMPPRSSSTRTAPLSRRPIDARGHPHALSRVH